MTYTWIISSFVISSDTPPMNNLTFKDVGSLPMALE